MSRILSSLTAILLLATPALAQKADVQITTTKVRGGVHMLQGMGGNLGLFVGEDGAFLIDDQYAPLSKKIQTAIEAVTPKKVRFLVNTHWHGDHTGGNENLGKGGAIIVAHENVRKRLSSGQFIAAFQRKVPPSSPAALPVVTFASDVTLHLNGIDIQVQHVDPAHTDGDSVVRFGTTNVVHMGDTYFNGMYPFFDISSGGAIEGMLKAVETVLARIDDDSVIIPGHGPVSDKNSLLAYTDMLKTVSSRMRKMIAEQLTLEQILAAEPTKDFDKQYGNGSIKNTAFVEMLYADMTTG